MTVPVINAGNQLSPKATLHLDIVYRTDANGASLTCTYASSNEPKPCAAPVRCSGSVTFQVPPLQVGEEWRSLPTAITQTPGDCACLMGHCDGSAKLGLSVLGNPPQPAGTLSNTSLRFSWNMSGQGHVDGFITTDHER